MRHFPGEVTSAAIRASRIFRHPVSVFCPVHPVADIQEKAEPQWRVHLSPVNAFMYDPASALMLKGIFLQDQKDAILLQRKTWMKRPWYQKAQESIVRLLAPLL